MSDHIEEEVVEKEEKINPAQETEDEVQIVYTEGGTESAAAEEEDIPEEYKGKSKKQLLEELKRTQEDARIAKAVQSGISDLAAKIQPANTQRLPEAPLEEPEEAVAQRFNQEFFSSQNPYAIFKKEVQKETQKRESLIASKLMRYEEQMLKLDPVEGPLYREMEGDIKEFIRSLPPQAQGNPDVFKYAFEQVKAKNMDKIIQKKVEEALAKQAGTKKEEVAAKPKPSAPYVSAGTASSARASSSGKKTLTFKNAAEKEKMQKAAEARGLSLEQYMG